jgi:tetratricopeptide (TPR) repeat protein
VKYSCSLLLGALWTTVTGLAVAASPTSASEFDRAVERLRVAKYPAQIAALRRVWSTWDRFDPARIEATIESATTAPNLDPAARVYAGLLGAFARTRRGDFSAAKQRIKSLGFVDKWLVVGPFDNEGKAGLFKDFAPELEFGEPIAFGRAYQGKERQVRWRAIPGEAFPYGWIDLGSLLRPQKKICAYVTTFVHSTKSTKAARPISIWIGASGAFELFFNGEPQLRDELYREHDIDRFASVVDLQPGFNDITVKLCGDEHEPMLSVRLADAEGRPDATLEVTNDAKAGEQARTLIHGRLQAKPSAPAAAAKGIDAKHPASSSSAAKGERLSAKPDKRVSGPVTLFERAISGKAPTAESQAQYAEYLLLTGGDDPSLHLARDLAVKAAEREPSIENLLLAAALGEDRNQRARWIEAAEAKAKELGAEDYRVLLGRAALERGGPNPPRAFESYGRVLEADPNNVEALVQRASLYSAVGLPRTALLSLDRALENNPTSVRLLGARAERLRELGRSSEAMDVERRYANLRFDDGAWLGHMIELSLARHDRKAASWWVGRLLDMSPHGPWAIALAARTYEQMGQFDRAIDAYERALTLAPEDTQVLRRYANLRGSLNQRREQLALLRRVIELMPQDKETRDYIEHLEPKRDSSDERYAWTSQQFLPLRLAPANGENRRTLRDLTVTTVFPNGLSSTFRQIVFQPLTDAAAAMTRQYAFQYQADRQIVQLRGAKVYRADGSTDEAIESGEAAANDPSISMYTSARNFYIQFPRLNPMDVVELRYRMEDAVPRNEYADYFGDVAYLQSDEPVHNAEYVLVTPKSRRMFFDTNLDGRLKHEVKEAGESRIDRFFAAALPPINPEPKMPPFPEVAGFVHASTFDSWQTMGSWYWGFVKDQFDSDEETRRLARRITEQATTELDKVKAVYGWVVKNTRYVALEFGVYGYKPYRAVQTVTRGWGDCKDKATAIVTLLKSLGIDATIVILRTQMRGDFNSKIASLAPFDHAIAYVPSLDLYLDGTAEGVGTRELPVMDRGALALRIHEGKPKLVRLPDHGIAPDRITREVAAQLEPDGSGLIELHSQISGSAAPEYRHSLEATATRRERMTVELGQEFPGLMLLPGAPGFAASGLDDIEKDVAIELRGKTPELARRENGQLSLAVTPGIRLSPAYAALSERRHDVRVMGLPEYDQTFTVKLPPGHTVLAAPQAARRSGPFGSYSVEIEQQASKVTVRARLTVSKQRILPSEYAKFREFCAEVDSAFGKRLVVGRP